MIDIAGEAAGHTGGPATYEINEKYLRDELQKIHQYVETFSHFWSESVCTIMADGWTGPTSRSLINFLIYNTNGTIFDKSVDTYGHVKDADYLFRFDEVVEVGEQNVVQFITDNEPSYKAAGRKLMEKWELLFWSPYAAHCVDLILERIGKKNVEKIVAKARMITGFIYNYNWLVALMQRYTNNHELLRLGIMRFATNFIALESLYRHRVALGEMFSSREWRDSRIASSSRHTGTVVEVPKLVLDKVFWGKVKGVMSIMEPLIKVLKLIDGDEKPTMYFLYDVMMRARTEIQSSFIYFQQYLDIIDKRWSRQLHHDLHAAGNVLRPDLAIGPVGSAGPGQTGSTGG